MAKIIKTLGIVLVSLIAAAAIGAVWLYNSGFTLGKPTYIYIDRNDNIDSVEYKIKETCHPQSMRAFQAWAILLKLEDRIRTGKYEVTADMMMKDLVRNIRNHNEQPIRIVVPSVRTMPEMAKRLSQQLMIDSAEIANYIDETSHLKNWGYTQENIPAFFIPNTYEVYWDMSVEALFERLHKENTAFWNEKRLAKLKEAGEYAGRELTKEEVATLASIIDSETANNAEKATIAAIYMNRLRMGMPLQSDPTVKFALQDWGLRRILHKHLEVESPYNTYKNTGLPPGPICVPSIAGIEAVLNHDKNNYIYMCAKEDFSGTHNFATNYAEHQKNAARYVKALNQRGIR